MKTNKQNDKRIINKPFGNPSNTIKNRAKNNKKHNSQNIKTLKTKKQYETCLKTLRKQLKHTKKH